MAIAKNTITKTKAGPWNLIEYKRPRFQKTYTVLLPVSDPYPEELFIEDRIYQVHRITVGPYLMLKPLHEVAESQL